MATVVVVAAHPDDEILGVGGTLARHAADGDRVVPVIVATGATSRSGEGDAGDAVDALRAASRAAAQAIGMEEPRFLSYPDQKLDTVAILDVTQSIEAVFDEIGPSIVYTHHGGDLNRDHRIVHEAVSVACRPVPGGTVDAVYGFETVSSTEWGLSAGPPFRPNHFVDVSAAVELKMRALDAYGMEMRAFPHARSVEAVRAQMTLRGATVGVEAAEAFVLQRKIVR
jgi:LmbE family N-acetylglucosaminyl deacetylase